MSQDDIEPIQPGEYVRCLSGMLMVDAVVDRNEVTPEGVLHHVTLRAGGKGVFSPRYVERKYPDYKIGIA